VSRTSRDKGARGELEVAAIFRAAGFDCDRVPNSGGLRLKGDLYGDVPVHVEVKRQERIRMVEWVRQAADECGDATPVVIYRPSRMAWHATLPLADLLVLLKRFRCRYCGRATHGVDVCDECLPIALSDEVTV
jgi:Holliday junction resolvase